MALARAGLTKKRYVPREITRNINKTGEVTVPKVVEPPPEYEAYERKMARHAAAIVTSMTISHQIINEKNKVIKRMESKVVL